MSAASCILVTGASRGLGYAITSILLRKGCLVLGIGRTQPSQSPQLQSLHNTYPKTFHYIPFDLADSFPKTPSTSISSSTNETTSETDFSRKIKSGLTSLLTKNGQVNQHRLDAVIHNAGILDPLSPIASADVASWRNAFEVNFFSCVELARVTLPLLKGKAGAAEESSRVGRFIAVSSGAAKNAYPTWGAYCTSKAALNMFVECLAVEEQSCISVAVRPGVVDTDMQTQIRTEGLERGMPSSTHSKFVNLHSSGKLLPPEDPGRVIANLALRATRDLSGKFVSWDAEDVVKEYGE
ncbi:hypothetical protein HK102_004481 [Quaeritorhiza haematococci]|nr:hypothetical protein HK102_004481 [Quaeritorhiza haematococci]